MDGANRARWCWTARKLGISAFLIVHLGATTLWVIPDCPLRRACFSVVSCYIEPLGMWDYWGMFAPDPMKETITLEADVIDARGIHFGFAFPKLADYTRLTGIPRFRHSKFAANLAMPGNEMYRVLAARHVIRQLALTSEAFPLEVRLIYQVRNAPPPGGPPADPMSQPYPYVLATIPFERPLEVTP
ncbi:MAG: hypothetical protein U0794_04255 [Isosphaeraceae bacterium]